MRGQRAGDPLERAFAEGIVQIHHQRTVREAQACGVRSDDAYVFACEIGMRAAPAHQVVARRFAERRRNLHTENLRERPQAREHDDAPHPRADVDERSIRRGNGQRAEQRFEVLDGRGLVVRGIRHRIADGLRIQFAEEEQGFGHHAVLCVEALAAPASGGRPACVFHLQSIRAAPSKAAA